MNNWSGVGRVVKDIEVRYAPESQTAIAKFKIAIDDGYGDNKTTDFIPIVCFGKTAENSEKFLGKGSMCGVTGKIKTNSYKNKEGAMVYTTEVKADRVEFLSKSASQSEARSEDHKPPEIPEGFQALEDDDDIPF